MGEDTGSKQQYLTSGPHDGITGTTDALPDVHLGEIFEIISGYRAHLYQIYLGAVAYPCSWDDIDQGKFPEIKIGFPSGVPRGLASRHSV